MADEIKQDLGFDASKALDTLKLLDSVMQTFEQRLQTSARAFDFFNKEAGRTVNALIQITKHGKNAASALGAVATAQGKGATANPAANAAQAAAAAATLAANLQQAGVASQSASVRIGQSMVKISTASQQSAQQVQSSIQRMTTSLSLLSRIVFTQFIVRGLSQLRNAFRTTVGDAIAFQKQLALISTIDDSGQSLTQLSDTVRRLSDEFNVPLLEVAAGLYQTVSNQIGDAAESTQFFSAALKFARATASSTENAVDLLSGVLKSYNLDVSESGRVSSIFFKTIDLGRISADQLANAFGRVGPAAAELGVELEEVGAAIAAISVRGSSTPESLTQFRNILTALTKPSVAMQRTMRELGFASAELAIKTLGVSGVLKELVGSTNGSSEALARLFPNIRGLNGVASLTADNLLTLANNTDEMREAGNRFTDAKFLQVIATDAEEVTAQVNRLKNAFTVDLGQSLLSTLANISDFTGGLDNFTALVKASPPLVLGLAGAVTTLGVAFTSASAGAKSLGKFIGGLALVPAAFGLGASIGEFLDTKLLEANFGKIKEIQAENTKELEKFSQALQVATDEANRADKDRLTAVLQVSRDISAAYLSQTTAAISANDSLVKNTQQSITSIIDAFEKLTNAEAQAQARALDLQDDSASRVVALQDKLNDIDFEKKTKSFTDDRKSLILNQRSAEFAALAIETLAKAGGDQEKINRGLNLFEQARKAAEASLVLADKIGDDSLAKRAKDQIRSLLEQQVKVEQRLQKQQDARIVTINKERGAHQDLLDQVRAQAKIVQDNTGIFNGNQQISAAEQTAREERRVAALEKLRDLSKQIDPNKLKSLGLEGFIDQFQQQLTQDPVRLSFTIANETDRIQQQLIDSFKDFTVDLRVKTGVDVSEVERALGRQAGTLDTPDKVFTALDDASKRAAELRGQLNDLFATSIKQTGVKEEIDALFTRLKELQSPKLFKGENVAIAQRAFDAIRNQLGAVSAQSVVSQDDIERLFNGIKTFNEAFSQSGITIKSEFNSRLQGINLLLGRLGEVKKLQDEQAQAPAATAIQAELQTLDRIQQGLSGNVLVVADKLHSATTGLQTGVNSLNTTGVTASDKIRINAELAAQAMAQQAAALERAANVNTVAAVAGSPDALHNGFIKAFAKGGFVQHFAGGGFARGVDTIPAMLAKGESVITAKNTQRFFSQIQAMNAGQTPVFRSDGGGTNSTTVGDIHIHESKSPQATADEIVRTINRASRRGSSRLRK